MYILLQSTVAHVLWFMQFCTLGFSTMSCHHPGKMHTDLSRNMKFSYILGRKGKYSLEENNELF